MSEREAILQKVVLVLTVDGLSGDPSGAPGSLLCVPGDVALPWSLAFPVTLVDFNVILLPFGWLQDAQCLP